MKKICMLLIVTSFMLNTRVFAQSPIKLLDIAAVPAVYVNVQPSPDTTELMVSFKVSNAEQAKKAHILFGTTQNTGDVLTTVANFTFHDGKYFLLYNEIEQEVKNYSARCNIKLSAQQNSAYSFITLYVEDNAGQNSEKLYFHK